MIHLPFVNRATARIKLPKELAIGFWEKMVRQESVTKTLQTKTQDRKGNLDKPERMNFRMD
jgi:hypothetical protein